MNSNRYGGIISLPEKPHPPVIEKSETDEISSVNEDKVITKDINTLKVNTEKQLKTESLKPKKDVVKSLFHGKRKLQDTINLIHRVASGEDKNPTNLKVCRDLVERTFITTQQRMRKMSRMQDKMAAVRAAKKKGKTKKGKKGKGKKKNKGGKKKGKKSGYKTMKKPIGFI
jgi:hypothetical protein